MLRTHYLSFYLSFVLMSYLCLSCTNELIYNAYNNLFDEAHYITVDEINKHLYAAVRDKDGGWNIIAYNFDNL